MSLLALENNTEVKNIPLGFAIPLATMSLLPASAYWAGQTWKVEVRAKDPFGKESLGSAEVVIANERPVCAQAVILPSSGSTDTDWSCECSEWSDGDPGDAPHDICTFLADGDVLAEGEECTLSHEHTQKGMQVTCVVTPHDGTDAGDPAETPTVTILNSVPSPNGLGTNFSFVHASFPT